MNIKEFNSLEEIEKYYDEKSSTYIFKENGTYIDLVVFNFDLKIRANISAVNIEAHNIYAWDINAGDIKAGDIDVLKIVAGHINAGNINAKDIDACDIDALNIKAGDIDAVNIKANNIDCGNIEAINIKALDINYFAVCFAYYNIKCRSIKGKRNNAKHFVLDGKLEIANDQTI